MARRDAASTVVDSCGYPFVQFHRRRRTFAKLTYRAAVLSTASVDRLRLASLPSAFPAFPPAFSINPPHLGRVLVRVDRVAQARLVAVASFHHVGAPVERVDVLQRFGPKLVERLVARVDALARGSDSAASPRTPGSDSGTPRPRRGRIRANDATCDSRPAADASRPRSRIVQRLLGQPPGRVLLGRDLRERDPGRAARVRRGPAPDAARKSTSPASQA